MAVVMAHARLAHAAERQVLLADVQQRVVDGDAAAHHVGDQVVDAVTLPRVFPTLKRIDFIVDAGFAGNFAMQFDSFRRWLTRHPSGAAKIARRIGNTKGMVRYEVSSLLRKRTQTFSGKKSYMLAVLPAIFAATAIANGRFPHRGVVPHTQHVDRIELFEAIRAEGIAITGS